MRILQINCVYQKGSTGKIVYDIHSGLKNNNIESYVLYGRGEREKNDPYVQKVCSEKYAKLNHFISKISGILYGGCFFSTRNIIKKIKKINPDIVHLHCINGYFVNVYKLLEWLADNQIKTVVTQHAEFFYTGGCGYAFDCNKWQDREGCCECPRLKEDIQSLFLDNTRKMWKNMQKAFSKFDDDNLRIVSVSPWLNERTASSIILGKRKREIVLNGTNTENIFKKRKNKELARQIAPQGEKIILHVTPSFVVDPTHNKGGYYVLELARKMKSEPVKFVIVGNAEERVNMENVIFVGKISDQYKLSEYYSMADVTLLTSKRETFSMICAESLSCGTPIVGFKAGAPEKIALKEYSIFVNYADLTELQNAVKEMLQEGKSSRIEHIARNYYDRRHMIEGYINIYKSMI